MRFRLQHLSERGERELADYSRTQPVSARRSHRASLYSRPQSDGQRSHDHRRATQPVETGRTDVGRRVQKSAHGPAAVIEGAVDPVDRPARDNLHLRTFVAENRGGLECALAGANYDHATASKPREVDVLTAVGGEVWGQVPRERGHERELAHANRHHNPPGRKRAAVREEELETVALELYA